jgi:hypothetical protein
MQPFWHPMEARNMPQRVQPLLQFEVAQIFLHDRGHRHSQRRRKVLLRHRP